jgi:hypothetical protein
MKLNRRSVLLGLGTLSASVGGIFGSGAFSSVEASRTVNLQTSADSSARLQFESNNSNIVTTESGPQSQNVIKLEQTSLNQDATTTFNDALKVTNNGDNDVGLSVVSADTSYSNSASGLVGDGNVLDIEDSNGDSIVDSAVNLTSNSNKDLSIVVNLQDNSESVIAGIDAIVFKAAKADYTP